MGFTSANLIMMLGHMLALFFIKGHARELRGDKNGISSYDEGKGSYEYNYNEARCRGKCPQPPYEEEHTPTGVVGVEEEGIHKKLAPLYNGIKPPHDDISKVDKEEYKARNSFMMKPTPYKGFKPSLEEDESNMEGKKVYKCKPSPYDYHDNQDSYESHEKKGGHNRNPFSISNSIGHDHDSIVYGPSAIHFDKLYHKESPISHDHEEEMESKMENKGGYKGKVPSHYHENEGIYELHEGKGSHYRNPYIFSRNIGHSHDSIGYGPSLIHFDKPNHKERSLRQDHEDEVESNMENNGGYKGNHPSNYVGSEGTFASHHRKGGHSVEPYTLSRSMPPWHDGISFGAPPAHYEKKDHKEISLSNVHQEESNFLNKEGYKGKIPIHYRDNRNPYKGNTISRSKPPRHDDDGYGGPVTHNEQIHKGNPLSHASHEDNTNPYKGNTPSRSKPPKNDGFGYDKPPPFHYDKVANKSKSLVHGNNEAKQEYSDDENGG